MSNNILQTRQIQDNSNTSLVTLLANVFIAANGGANTVMVSANGGSTLSAHSINFVNTAFATIVITDKGDGNANIAISTAGIGANAANTATVSANGAGTLVAKQLNFVNSNSNIVSVSDAGNGNANISFADTVSLTIPLSGLVSTIAAGANVAYVRSPRPFTVTTVRASLFTKSTGGAVNVQVTVNGSNLFTTLLTVDNGSYTSVGSNVTPVLALTAIPDDANILYSIISAGGNALGLIVTLTGIAT